MKVTVGGVVVVVDVVVEVVVGEMVVVVVVVVDKIKATTSTINTTTNTNTTNTTMHGKKKICQNHNCHPYKSLPHQNYPTITINIIQSSQPTLHPQQYPYHHDTAYT